MQTTEPAKNQPAINSLQARLEKNLQSLLEQTQKQHRAIGVQLCVD